MIPIQQTKIELSYIMPVFFNQKDTKVLTDLLEAYSKIHPDILRRIQFVIVDDCSPIEVKIPNHIHVNYQLYGSPDKPGGLSIQLCKSEKKEFYIRYSS